MNASSAESPESEAQPFGSLSEIRHRHAALLKQTPAPGGDWLNPTIETELIGFLRAVQMTGRSLKDPDDRDVAQGIMDFWAARLISANPEAANELRSFALESADEESVAEVYAQKVSQQRQAEAAIRKANAWLEERTPEEEKDLRRLLLQMVRLSDTGAGAFSALLEADRAGAGDPTLAPLLEALERIGILKTEEDGEGRKTFSVAHPMLFTHWGFLRRLVSQRRRFREAAKLWDARGRNPELLLSDAALLDEMRPLERLNPIEREFAELSRSFRADEIKAERNRLLRWIAVLAVLFGAALVGWFGARYQTGWARRENAAKDQALKEAKANLEVAQRNAERSQIESREALDYKNEADRLRADLRILSDFLSIHPDLPEEVAEIVESHQTQVAEDPQKPDQQTTASALAQTLAAFQEPGQSLQPGVGIYAASETPARGSLGIFLKKKDSDQVYLAAPQYILSGKPGTQIFAGSAAGKRPFARISDMGQSNRNDLESIALARIDDPASVSNVIAGVGRVEFIEANPRPGMEVKLIGSGSGITTGRIKRIDKDGTIITTRISQPGDGGAPVVTADGNRLVGLLIGRRGKDESTVRPIRPILEAANLEIYRPPAKNEFGGVLAEMFVSADGPAFIGQAQKYIEALQTAGIVLPVPRPQPRRRVPSDQSEVRYYYHPDDEELARRVLKLLVQAGIPENKIRILFVDDRSAPKRFIQVSLAKTAFAP